MMQYNFIVVCLDNDMYDYAYSQVNTLPYAFFDNHFKHKTDNRNEWNEERANYYLDCWNNMKEKKDNICFVLFSDCLRLEEDGFFDVLRDKFPSCKIVLFFQDLVSKDKRKQDFLKYKRDEVDLIYSFDNNDANEYNLLFHNIPYSYSKQGVNYELEYDITFVGQAKDRLEQIYKCLFYFNSLNIQVHFYLIGVSYEEKLYVPNVEYVSWMPYKDYLQIVLKSKCILEVMQHGGNGNTIRVPEAIALNKLLLSNNVKLSSNPFYDSKYMRIFDDISKVDILGFLNQEANYSQSDIITPCRFLHDIDAELSRI